MAETEVTPTGVSSAPSCGSIATVEAGAALIGLSVESGIGPLGSVECSLGVLSGVSSASSLGSPVASSAAPAEYTVTPAGISSGPLIGAPDINTEDVILYVNVEVDRLFVTVNVS